jgi:propanol-preferring alcohol dehydrogenase
MVLTKVKTPLVLQEVAKPIPQKDHVLVRVLTCGVCRTDLHIYDGELTQPKLPLIMGHQIVGVIESFGSGGNASGHFKVGDVIGVPWLGGTCKHCYYCEYNKENLCDYAVFTGYQRDGGFAEYVVANLDYCFPIPKGYDSVQAAPLLCAGLIGYRSYRKCGDAMNIGFYGFGNAATILIQLAKYEGKKIFAFTRPGDLPGQTVAKEMGAHWVGSSDQKPSEQLDAAIIFAPVGSLVPQALKILRKGGVVVCGGIHMTDIPSFSYDDLWGERMIESVANLTRRDGQEFLELAPKVPVKNRVKVFKLEEANEALQFHREGKSGFNAVLRISES